MQIQKVVNPLDIQHNQRSSIPSGQVAATGLRGVFTADRPFCFGLLAPGVVLIWIQCILYARYIHVDGGITTIAINFSRCAFIVVACAIAWRLGFPRRAQRRLGIVCIVLMTLASFLFYVQSISPELNLVLIASIFAGCGLAWGGGQCINLYVRLDIREAVFYTFMSMAFSGVVGLFIAFVPDDIAYFISMLLPVIVLIMYDRAEKALDLRDMPNGVGPSLTTTNKAMRENIARSDSDPTGAASRDGQRRESSSKDVDNRSRRKSEDLYGSEPRSTWVRIAFGIALFSFVLGASRGFPSGSSIELPSAFQVVQFVGLIAICASIVWATDVKNRGMRFSTLWLTQLAAMAFGVILLATGKDFAISTGATLIAITNLFQVAFLWFLSYDIARYSKLPSYIVLGFFWLIHLLFRETGRLVILTLGPLQSISSTILIAVMICLLAVSMGFLITDDIPKIRPFFSDLEPEGTKRAQQIERNAKPMRDEAIADEERSKAIIESLQKNFSLTLREAEIVIPLSQGRSTSYIAGTLYLSENTVRTYVKNIYTKLDIHNKQDLIDFIQGF